MVTAVEGLAAGARRHDFGRAGAGAVDDAGTVVWGREER
jgi:hypothetical protein